MKKLVELHFYGKKLKMSGMWERYLSPAEQQIDGAVTMVLSPLDDEKHKLTLTTRASDPRRVYIARPFCCNRKFTAELRYAQYERYFWCPNCGYKHPYKHTRYISNSDENIPLDLYVRLYEYKKYIKLSLSYEAIRFEHDDFSKEVNNVGNVREDFIFDVKTRTAIRKLYINNHLSSELEIGFLKDWRLLQRDTALYYLRDDIKSLEGKNINVVFAKLREAINKQAKQIKYSKRNMGINGGYHHYRPLDSLLKIANQVRFWDSQPINFWGGHQDSKKYTHEYATLESWAMHYELDMGNGKFYDVEVDKLMSQGLTYHQAAIKVFNLPNVKAVRKHLSFDYFAVIKRLYAIETSKANEIVPMLAEYSFTSRLKIVERIKSILSIYKSLNSHLLFDYATKHAREWDDAIDTYHKLPLAMRQEIYKKPPRLREFHDYVVARHLEFEDSDFAIQISPKIIERLNQTIGKYAFTTLLTNYQCIKAGKLLHNCAKTYADKCNDKKQLVLLTDKNGQYVALLEIDRFTIVQAKLIYNTYVGSNIEINNLICEYARVVNLKINTSDIKPELYKTQIATA